MSAAREKLVALIDAKERETYAAYRNEEPMREQELTAELNALREDLEDLDLEEAQDLAELEV